MQGEKWSLGPTELYNQHTCRHLSGPAPPSGRAPGAQLTEGRH